MRYMSFLRAVRLFRLLRVLRVAKVKAGWVDDCVVSVVCLMCSNMYMTNILYTNDIYIYIWLLSDCYMIAIWIYSKRLEFGKLMWWMFWSQARIAVLAQLLHILQTQLGPEMAPDGTWWHLSYHWYLYIFVISVAHWAPWIPGVSLTVAFWCWTLPRACW